MASPSRSVPFFGRLNHPNFPDTNFKFEFVTSAAVNEAGHVVEGCGALDYDVSFPFKTILVYLAFQSVTAHRRDVLMRLLYGSYLLGGGAVGPTNARFDAAGPNHALPAAPRDGTLAGGEE